MYNVLITIGFAISVFYFLKYFNDYNKLKEDFEDNLRKSKRMKDDFTSFKKMIPSGFKAEWHDFYEAFDISKYEELPADRFDDAMGYILGEWVPEEAAFAIPDGKRLVDEGNFNAMKNRLELLNDRYTELNDINRDAYMLRMQAEALQLKILEFETKTTDPVREASMLARTLN